MNHGTTKLNSEIDKVRLLILTSYPANRVTEMKLQLWAGQPSEGELREIQPMHDCIAALQEINAPIEMDVDQIHRLQRDAEVHSAPADQRFGKTLVYIVQLSDDELANVNVCRNVIGIVTDKPNAGTGETFPDGSQLARCSEEVLVLICGSMQFESCVAFAVGPLRLLETLKHKVQGQFAEYENAFRQQYLDATAALRQGLQRLNSSWGHSADQGDEIQKDPARAVRESHRLTHDYTNALLTQGPVRQIETMLAANLKNLEQTLAVMMPNSRPKLLSQRISSLEMLLAQVRSDVEYALPMLEAAQSVTQSFHTQMLADLAGVEAMGSQQRASESAQRDRHTLTLTMLGLWIGMNQLLNGWLSIPELAKQWKLVNLIGCLALPTILTVLFWLGIRILSWTTVVPFPRERTLAGGRTNTGCGCHGSPI